MDSNTEQDEVGEASVTPKLPQEIQDPICEYSFAPRNIVVSGFHKDPELPLFQRLDIVGPYTQPPTLSVSSHTRNTALRSYEMILGHSSPGSNIYFNFKIDTLVINTRYSRGKRTRMIYGDNITDESIRTLRECFKHRENNLQRVQSLALGDYQFSDLTGDERRDLMSANHEDLVGLIAAGLQNLRELIIVFHKMEAGELLEHDLRKHTHLEDPEVAERCRKLLKFIFEDGKLEHPRCQIPEIRFLEYNDPRAPKFY